MGNVWLVADEHFCHANIIRYCNRPYSTVEEMDADIIAKHNSVVAEDDVVYHLGDLIPFTRDFVKIRGVLRALHGRHILIPGNHDRLKAIEKAGVCEIAPLIHVESFRPEGGKPVAIVMCHYKLSVWPSQHRGFLHVYGHSHGTKPPIDVALIDGVPTITHPACMDIGVDTHDFYPYSLCEVVDTLLAKIAAFKLSK